jgi:hypothetical protein
MQRSVEDVKRQLQELKPTLRKRFKVETIDISGPMHGANRLKKATLTFS